VLAFTGATGGICRSLSATSLAACRAFLASLDLARWRAVADVLALLRRLKWTGIEAHLADVVVIMVVPYASTGG